METLNILPKTSVFPQNQYNSTSTTKAAYSEQTSLKLKLMNREGDTVTLNYKEKVSVIYDKSAAAGATSTADTPAVLTPEEGEKLRTRLKIELFSYKEALIKSLFKGGDHKPLEAIQIPEEDLEIKDLEAKIPVYWNAENTSQRIVDFATSFLSAFKGESSEFFKTIKGAIETGFKAAKDMLGELPGPVGKLIDKTYRLTMEKLGNIEQQTASAPNPVQAENSSAKPNIDVVA
jgi:hypothetical protein